MASNYPTSKGETGVCPVCSVRFYLTYSWKIPYHPLDGRPFCEGSMSEPRKEVNDGA